MARILERNSETKTDSRCARTQVSDLAARIHQTVCSSRGFQRDAARREGCERTDARGAGWSARRLATRSACDPEGVRPGTGAGRGPVPAAPPSPAPLPPHLAGDGANRISKRTPGFVRGTWFRTRMWTSVLHFLGWFLGFGGSLGLPLYETQTLRTITWCISCDAQPRIRAVRLGIHFLSASPLTS